METLFTQSKHLAGRLNWRLLPALLLALLCTGNANAQSILSESFESSTFPPTGWTRAVTSGSSTTANNWARQTNGFSTTPSSVSAYSGSYYAWYNTWNVSSGMVELRTPALNFSGTSQVQVSFWYYRNNSYAGYTDFMEVYVNTSPTVSGATLLSPQLHGHYQNTPVVPTAGWYKYTYNVPTTYNGTTNYIIFEGNADWGPDLFLDEVQVYNLAPCTGPVASGTISPAGPLSVCPGSTVNLSTTGTGIAANIIQQWQYSTNGGTSWNSIAGATNTSYTTFPITATTSFRFFTLCTNTGDSSKSTPVTINVTGGGAFPQYATLPFFESFESWTNGCSTTDLPSQNWTNAPSTGNGSWRRNDQGSSASWTSATVGGYTPASVHGTYSARFHSYYAQNNKGALTLYVDCSQQTGAKELEFYKRIDAGTYQQDSLNVELSTDGGISWTRIARFGPGTGTWNYHGGIIINSNSATTQIRFIGSRVINTIGYTDIHLDAVRIVPPCNAKPVAGTIDSVTACPGKNFTLSTKNTSLAAGLAYTWQSKPTGSTISWSNLPGGNVPRPTANITVPTSFRVIVTCTNTTPNPISDTSAVVNVKLDPFYYCYCDMPTSIQYPTSAYTAIGNVTISKRPSGTVLLNNTSPAVHPYSSFARTVPAPTLIRDSTYRFAMTTISGTNGFIGGPAVFFLDYNRNGVWDVNATPSERIMSKTASSSGGVVFQDFAIPSNASVGLTGLRAITAYNLAQPVNPCGAFSYNGEVEDYLVYIEYQPCSGPVNAGTAYISDTSVCPNYTVDLWDTSYEKQRTGITRTWEVSTDMGYSYSAIANSTNKDTMFNVVVTASSYGLRYRLRVVCSNTGDTTYSNYLSVSNPDPTSCYPFATAVPPGTADSSDIGSFVIGPYVNPQPMVVSGPHLLNPAANRRRTDYTKISPMTLAADSTYRIAIYHTMRSATHANALVSVYIDFNRDGQYTEVSPGHPYPPELIYRGVTTASNFYLDTFFKMPSTMIGGVPTGLRVILNNDTNPAGSGNNGAGSFTSGEVEDYVVTLSRTNLGVGGKTQMENLALFPNPTSNKATLVFDAPSAVGRLDMVVTTIAGQTVMNKSFDNVGKNFSTEIDLSGKAKGIYFVELKAENGEKITRKLILQ